MIMKSNHIATGALFAAAWGLLGGSACNNVGTSLLVEGVIPPESDMGCSFEAGGSVFRSTTLFNTRNQLNGRPQVSMRLFAQVFNAMADEAVPIEGMPEENFVLPNRVTPVRFDYRWECESNGFTGALGPFVLPQFSLAQPFCLNERDQVGDFVGFDTVPATGGAITPGGQGIVSFTPIPAQLGQSFDEFFALAAQANACCANPDGGNGSCNDITMVDLSNRTSSCGRLQNLFDAVSGGGLNANVPADVIRWQPYSIYDGTAAPAAAAGFPMRLRGRFEFITGAGAMVTSNELLHQVEICRDCGLSSTRCTF